MDQQYPMSALVARGVDNLQEAAPRLSAGVLGVFTVLANPTKLGAAGARIVMHLGSNASAASRFAHRAGRSPASHQLGSCAVPNVAASAQVVFERKSCAPSPAPGATAANSLSI